MKKNLGKSKTVSVVKKQRMMVCPQCGHENFEKKEGFHLLGQQFVCAKCKSTFRKAALIKAKTINVKVDENGSVYKSRGKKFGRRRR